MRYVLAAMGLALLVSASPLACTATIVPPPQPREPVPVFVLVHGWTSSLVIPARDGTPVRFAYGDWRYYALAQNTIPNGVRALLWPSQGTLGRARLPGPAEAARVRGAVAIDTLHEVIVDRAAAARLVDELDAVYAARQDTEVANPPYGMDFVHHDASYVYFRNSNHMIADWLRRLGCQVRGPTFGSRWRVADAG